MREEYHAIRKEAADKKMFINETYYYSRKSERKSQHGRWERKDKKTRKAIQKIQCPTN